MDMITYTIDAEDRIVSLSDGWDTFAIENQAPDSCLSSGVLNRRIWDFISDLETRHLYQVINGSVRSSGRPVTVPFRCDAPDRRRFLEMKIVSAKQKQIEYKSALIREEPREPVALLMAGISRSDELVKMCSMCKQVNLPDGAWVEAEVAIAGMRLFEKSTLPGISYGICPKCYKVALAEIEEYLAKQAGKGAD